MDDAESARHREGEYYGYSPLEILSDSYFTHPVQYSNQQIEHLSQVGGSARGAWDSPDYAGGGIGQENTYQPYQTQSPMDLDVLSAEQYGEGAYPQRSSRQRSGDTVELWGGFLASGTGDKQSPSPPRPAMKTRRAKKEASKSTSADESAARQRGRPRLDTRDQTAAERRRTQIRLAQRAYRQRKETTISGLNKRVTSLEKTIEDMNKTLLDFNGMALATGIQTGNPALAELLESTIERFAELAKNVTYVSDGEEEEPQAEGDEAQQRNPRRVPESSAPRPVDMLGYQTTFEAQADDFDGEIAQQNPTPQAQMDASQSWISTETLQQYPVEMPDQTFTSMKLDQSMQNFQVRVPDTTAPEVAPPNDQYAFIGSSNYFDGSSVTDYDGKISSISLALPNSYAYQETSFARRLLRTSVETSWRLMTDPRSRPEEKRRLCKFTWCFTNSPTIIAHIDSILKRTVKQNLELWQAPLYHIGGAGLHYPRAGLDVGEKAPEGWANQMAMGPMPPVENPETQVPESMLLSEVVRQAGMDGEWFDSNDVEQYLRTKGLFLDSESRIVELMDPDPSMAPGFVASAGSAEDSSSRESSKEPQSPEKSESAWPDDRFLQNADYLFKDDADSATMVPDIDMDFASNLYSTAESKKFVPALEWNLDPSPVMPTFSEKPKAFLDVEVFLSNLTQTSVCLGRTAGFRRAAVDSALKMATTTLYG